MKMDNNRTYVATVGSYSDYHVLGVFSTIDKAILAIKEYDEDSYIHCDWRIKCVYLDEILD
jgi:hypothetical protein